MKEQVREIMWITKELRRLTLNLRICFHGQEVWNFRDIFTQWKQQGNPQWIISLGNVILTRSRHLTITKNYEQCSHLSFYRLRQFKRTSRHWRKIIYDQNWLSFSELISMGYWPSVRSRCFFACLWTETKSRSINSLKKERGQYPAILTEQTWSIKDLLYGFWGNFAYGIKQVVPSGQDGSILPARVANHSARFGSFCPLAELAI